MKRTIWRIRVAIIAAASIACLLPAPAHADEDGWVRNGYMTDREYDYLMALRNQGFTTPATAGAMIQGGHLICQQLRRGVSPGEHTERYFPKGTKPQMVAAAQSQLCPDTLR